MIKKEFLNTVFFTKQLLLWNAIYNTRQMPWKNEKDPYKIWISEIILQQTQVKQGLGYYERFIYNYPTVQLLAKASDESVFKVWEGLGYYSRCRNLLHTARFITNTFQGNFPKTYNDIVALKGIGPYTAAAIASFAYNLPHAVVDGNVVRVLSRFFGIKTPVASTAGKVLYITFAQQLLEKSVPGLYNQAIMDFGATVCKPKLPLCSECPLKKKCYAFNTNLVYQLPVKAKSIKRAERYLNYLVVVFENNIYVRQRVLKDIWQNLNEFILIETNDPPEVQQIIKSETYKLINKKGISKITEVSEIRFQQLTHLNVSGIFIKLSIKNVVEIKGYKLVPFAQLSLLPFPKFITAYLKDYSVPLFATDS